MTECHYICTYNHVTTMYGSEARGRTCRQLLYPRSPHAGECGSFVRRLADHEEAAHRLGGRVFYQEPWWRKS